jgi:hypothetical protein
MPAKIDVSEGIWVCLLKLWPDSDGAQDHAATGGQDEVSYLVAMTPYCMNALKECS